MFDDVETKTSKTQSIVPTHINNTPQVDSGIHARHISTVSTIDSGKY